MLRFCATPYFFTFAGIVLLTEVIIISASQEFTGKQATDGQFPFVIRLYSKLKDSTVTYCTATIVTSIKLLTAGHCCNTRAYRFVVLGDTDQTDFVSSTNKSKYSVHDVRKVIIHPDFERTETKLVYDLCLLILGKPLSLKSSQDSIRISYDKLKEKRNCTALGWGSNFGYQIQHKLYYKDAIGYRCNLQFGSSPKYWFLCLEPHSVCPGDSGGPLVCDGMLYGIASFFIGHGDDSNPKCEEGVVDYYTDLSTVRDFIENNSSNRSLKASLLIQVYVVLIHYLRYCSF
ncbi:hypothetical protein RUM44_008910 [Polyplax serrata]|uniref:Peptidase S1 domain-containing protein n=1 Tax=Polyplax serrata TaxID=468196 RepID=A0ABR1AR66_POLSC